MEGIRTSFLDTKKPYMCLRVHGDGERMEYTENVKPPSIQPPLRTFRLKLRQKCHLVRRSQNSVQSRTKEALGVSVGCDKDTDFRTKWEKARINWPGTAESGSQRLWLIVKQPWHMH